ncbi:MAG: hypothetical protein LAN18_16275 [Acidobacteriia bacterium]|nr:hypothetical protein [Terriglobia bacterium]
MMSERIGVRPLCLLLLGALFFFSPPASRAQTNSEEPQGTTAGNYNVQQSAEIGYRVTSITGNQNTYQTFAGYNPGARLLDYTLSIRSLNHQGLLFDNINFSNFGYGGDPDNASRLRVNKNKLYDFSATFRRHRNFWDYSMLANPLNPVPIGTGLQAFAVNQSPHALYLVRRMQDYDLTLLPQSRVRFRLGYSHYANEGPSLTSFHGTTDFLLAQSYRVKMNTYRMGVDFRVLSKTTISYDQFLEYDRQDTSDTLANTPFLVSTSGVFPGTLPVDMGLNWYYSPAGTNSFTCNSGTSGAMLAPVNPFVSGGFINPNCKQYASYSRTNPIRNFMPTERLSFQSRYVPKLEMAGSASYSSGHSVITGLNDSANEWTGSSTSMVRNLIVSGPADAKRIFAHANWSGVFSLTDKIRIVDSLRYDQWQTPAFANVVNTSVFAAGTTNGLTGILLPPASFAPLVASGPSFASICPSPYNAATCPQHQSYNSTSGAPLSGSSSCGAGNVSPCSTAAADFSNTLYSNYMSQRLITNTVQIQADFTKRISGRIGYMYENKRIRGFQFANLQSTVYYPGGAGGSAANDFWAARGNCPYATGTTTFHNASGTCVQNTDGTVTFTPAPADNSDIDDDTIHEHVGLAGLTLRPMDTLRINADFEFGYNDFSFTRIWPRNFQSYKVHVNYKPRTWATIDGSVDIRGNRDNVTSVNNIEHGRTYGVSVMLARGSKLAYTAGYNYTDLYTQTFICFRDSVANTAGPPQMRMTGPGGVAGYLIYTPTNSPCPNSISTLPENASAINLGTMAFYSNKQHYVSSDLMWKPVNRVTTGIGYTASFAGGSTVFLDPLQPGGTLAFTYQRPFASIQFDIYKGLSFKTTWNYYGYNLKTPFNPSVPVTVNVNGTVSNTNYALQPIVRPDFNGSTVMMALRYAF